MKWIEEDGFEERMNGRGFVVVGWAPQFTNERLVVQILKIGVSVGANELTAWGDEKSGFMLKKEHVKNAIDQLMNEGNEGIKRRKRAKVFGEKENKAIEVGGSSYLNMTLLIQDIIQQSSKMGVDMIPTSHRHEN
ncbi:UDP-glycosyltransferase 73C9 [Gossypium raimondii]|uniref:UDP-glycosyltransferase 73C9 n=1 Tax=Gossypium raimondii TaxID=29730 RepID=UPI00063A9971|nr:UDP-glycosyltransferase 73C9 [Gossypium raimondii]